MKPYTMKLMYSFLAALTCCLSAPTLAQESKTDDLHLSTVVNAVPLNKGYPKFPKKAAKKGYEGWVTMSYVINEDGTTSDIVVEDSSNSVFEKNAVKAVEGWEFTPATSNGKAIRQCRNRVQVDFRMGKQKPAASRWFISKYGKASEFIGAGNVEKTKEIIAQMKEKGRWNGYEDMFFNMLNIQVASQENNITEELKALEGVLRHKRLLEPAQYTAYAYRAFLLSLKTNAYGKAKRVYERLNQAHPEHQTTQTLQPYYDKLINLIESDQPLPTQGLISSRNYWQYQLHRNQFQLTNIQGKLNSLEVRCDNKHTSFLIEENSQWQVPSQWGQCAVYVFGDENAHFTLVELAG